jgi:formate hydrogenlyase subunit 3/multisubunit Na+/H+ antiporter MnhD subunit
MPLLLAAMAVLVGSGVVALFCSRFRISLGIGAFGVMAAFALGIGPALRTLIVGTPLAERLPWTPPYGAFEVGLDRLSAFLLVPLLVLALLCAFYGSAYLKNHREPKRLAPAALFFNLLVASMMLVLIARDALVFLVAWEAMTLSSYLLVTLEHEKAEVRRAGWVYLIAGHVGVTMLLLLFLLLARQTGSVEFETFRHMGSPRLTLSIVLFALATLGFGVKAGFVPMHVWLPEAHAAAPSHVSALMSGMLIKLGLYGLLRTLTFLQPATWWGPALIVLGFAGALLGITQAMYQRDLKRVLAYSSIENIGLITIGIGVAYWGLSRGDARLAALGMLGAAFHLWNHVLMKGLMFLAAGSVLHGTGTRDLEALGGLGKKMPATAVAMIVGAVAIAGLPPLNGFASESLLYQGLFAGGTARAGAAALAPLLSIGLLALIGGLAALCFVRLLGVTLLGAPRSDSACHAHESSVMLLSPMFVLAAGSILVAVWPRLVIGPIAGLAAQLLTPAVSQRVDGLAGPVTTLGLLHGGIWIALAVIGGMLALRIRRPAPATPTWDCGYAAPSARMQYTASGFAQFFSRLLPTSIAARLVTQRRPTGSFPRPGAFATECKDPITRSVFEPFFARWADRFSRLRWLQQGILHVYLLYILVVVMVALAWMSLRAWIWPSGG